MKLHTLLITVVIMSLPLSGTAATSQPIETIERGLLPGQFLEGELQTGSIAAAMLRSSSYHRLSPPTLSWKLLTLALK